jgi:protein-tyrosine phosphatase
MQNLPRNMKTKVESLTPESQEEYLVGHRKDGFSWFLSEIKGEPADDQNLEAARRFSSLAEALAVSTEHSCNVFELVADEQGNKTAEEILIDLEKAESVPYDGCFWLMDDLLFGPNPISLESAQTEQHVARLRQAGIRSVVSLLSEQELYWSDSDRNHVWFENFIHHVFPVRDGAAPSLRTMGLILDVVDESLRCNQGTFVHCFGGRGRAGLVAACFIARHGAATGQSALNLLTKRRMEHGLFQPSPETPTQREFAEQWKEGQ